ncbi:hypothetical protein [Pyxidicoccus fallax]|uniref:hypothetical protein n=1 Tax=Pyxidicoccus fallax TaxID=394095 RepID=UPI001FE3606F|nr:hypothetical protein [Pyxidicoccus fallax]
MLSASAPSLVAGFWERFARDLDFEPLGVEWVPETAQPLKRGKLRLMRGHVWHRVQETGTCTGPDAP